MSRELITIGSFQGVAAGQTATLTLPAGAGAGVIYHGLRIIYGTGTAGGANQANMEAEISEVRLLIDGVVQRVFSAAQLFAILAENGIGFQTGQLPIWFSEPWRRSVQGEEALAWGVADVATFQVEIDIAAGATAPTLDVRAYVERKSQPLGPIVKWRRFTVAPAATGVFNFSTLPRDAGNYGRLHFFENAAGDINSIEVIREGRQVFSADDADFEALMTELGLTPQAALTTVAFDADQQVSNFLPMRVPLDRNGARSRPVTDFRVNIDYAVAAASTLIAEILGPRD